MTSAAKPERLTEAELYGQLSSYILTALVICLAGTSFSPMFWYPAGKIAEELHFTPGHFDQLQLKQ